MSGAAFNRPLRVLSREKAENEAGSERVAASDAIEDFKIFTIFRLVKLAIAIADRSPIVQGGSFCLAQSGGNHVEWVIFHNLDDHLLERIYFELGMMLIKTGDLVSDCGGEVFFIAQHYVHVRCDAAIDLLCLLFAAGGFP